MQLGMVGLGRMGGNMTERLRGAGHDVKTYDPHVEATASSLEELAQQLDAPRSVWLMVPAGIVDSIVSELAPHLAEGDTIVDGGNSYYVDDLRRSRGLPALSAQWTGWLGVGLATRAGALRTRSAYANRGVHLLTAPLAFLSLERALAASSACALIAPVSWADFGVASSDGERRLFDLLAAPASQSTPASEAISPQVVRSASPAEQAALLRRCLKRELAAVLRTDPERLDPNRPFGMMGVDSLRSLDFVRRLSAALGVSLSATAIFNYPTIVALERELAERLSLPAAGTIATDTDSTVSADSPAAPGDEDISEEDAILTLMRSARSAHR